MTTQRDPDEPGGAIPDDTGSLGPATEAIASKPASGSGWLLGNRYRVIDRIGVGGMAEVFRAHDELLARDVAVKVFRTHALAADTAAGVERQQIELHALARLNHPNLITLFDGSLEGDDEGSTFLVMELINGPTLAARIADGPLAEPEARAVGIQIADALAYVHAEGMVHRDVKPANILLGTDRTAGDTVVRARLSDFGIVRLLGSERMTSANFTLGTASYLAPEQARGFDVGPVADVYSLGLVLIESHTGVRSYDGPPLEAVMARLARSPDVPHQLPQPWPSLLAAMTALDQDDRPTAAEVAQTLRDGGSRTAPIPLAAAAGMAGAAAGSAGAGAAAGGVTGATGAAALADAQTVGFAAVSGSTVPPAVLDPWEPTDEPRRRRAAGWLLAAVLVVALAVGGFVLLRPTSGANAPADQGPGTTKHTSQSPGAHSSPATNSSASARGTPSASTTRSTASSTSTAPRTSAAPPSSTPPSSSAATSPAPPTSSAPASSLAAVPPTSSAPH